MGDKVKGVYTNGSCMVIVRSYLGENLGCSKVVKKSPSYEVIEDVEVSSKEFYSNYELCGYAEV